MVFEGGFHFLKNDVIFEPIDRIWIFGVFNLLSTPRRLHLPYSFYEFGK